MTTVTLGLPPLPPKWTGKFRKRPVVVEAVQLVDDDACDWDEIARWCGGRIYNIETSPGAEPQTLIDITTLEGTMTAGEGWWVVRGVVGEFHPVRADIFKATYEPAGSTTGGKAVYETWRAAVPDVVCNVPGGPWEDLPVTVQAGFAAIDGYSGEVTRLAADRDRLRELLDEIGTLAANAPEDGDCFAVCEEIAMRIAATGVPDDGRHPDGCTCQFCREDEREERDREELDDDIDNTIPDTERGDL